MSFAYSSQNINSNIATRDWTTVNNYLNNDKRNAIFCYPLVGNYNDILNSSLWLKYDHFTGLFNYSVWKPNTTNIFSAFITSNNIRLSNKWGKVVWQLVVIYLSNTLHNTLGYDAPPSKNAVSVYKITCKLLSFTLENS